MDKLMRERKSGCCSLGWLAGRTGPSPPLHPSIRPSSVDHDGGAENICSYQVITAQAKTAGGAVPTSCSTPQLSPHPSTSLRSAAELSLLRERRVEGKAQATQGGAAFLSSPPYLRRSWDNLGRTTDKTSIRPSETSAKCPR